MRVFNAVASAALLASCSLFGAVRSEPNFEISKTSLSIDRHREALDNGEIVVRVQRTDDLFSDPTANEGANLLLEKNTHIALRIQLDPSSGNVNVNDEALDVTSSEPQVTAVKAEAFRLPVEHDSPIVDADMMLSLLAQMSPGIVGVEVRVESQQLTPSVETTISEGSEDTPSVEAITVRRVGLWIRVTEVEGQEVPHTTTTYTPILQLVVTGSGDKVHKIETLSIDGQSPLENAMNAPGHFMPHSLPPYEPADPNSEHRPHFPHPHPHFHPHPHHHEQQNKTSGFLSWFTELLGLNRPSFNNRVPGYPGRRGGCKGMRRPTEELAVTGEGDGRVFREGPGRAGNRVETHRPMVENPFSGFMDDGEEDSFPAPSENETVGRPRKHRFEHGHRHGHRRHGKCARFFHRFAIGFIYGMALMGTIFMHPITLMAMSGLAASALLFHVVRRVVIKRRGGQVTLGDDEDDEPLTPKEKEALLESVVVEDRISEDLPKYEPKA